MKNNKSDFFVVKRSQIMREKPLIREIPLDRNIQRMVLLKKYNHPNR